MWISYAILFDLVIIVLLTATLICLWKRKTKTGMWLTGIVLLLYCINNRDTITALFRFITGAIFK